MDGKLDFIQSWSLAKFKENHGISKIETIRNDKGRWFRFLGGSGAVATSFTSSKEMMVSQVVGSDKEPFLLLHNPSEVKVEETL